MVQLNPSAVPPTPPARTHLVLGPRPLSRCARLVVWVRLGAPPPQGSNFVALCQAKFYDGLHFHRVIKGSRDDSCSEL